MPALAELQGFPPIQRLTFNQGSDHRPGRCIVETGVAGPTNITDVPRHTVLRISTDTFNGVWNDMRVVKAARVQYGKMRIVLEDERWKLYDFTMHRNFNHRTSLGVVLSGSEKTIEELLTEIATVTGLTITAGNLPTFKPPAQWAGRVAGECLEDLLRDTGCRMVYDPSTEGWVVSSAATGQLPDTSTRIFRPAPVCKYQTLAVRTRPILYEDEIACTAREINTTTGAADALSSSTLPDSPTETYGQTRFRLWQPNSVTHPSAKSNSDVIYFDKRAKAHLFDPLNPMYEQARIVRDSFERYPHHEALGIQSGPVAKLIETTGGGAAFLTDHPIMMTDATGVLLKTCSLVTSYHIYENSELKRDTVSVTLDGTAGTKTIDVDWLKPVNSTLSDMSGSVWSTLHSEVAEAMANKYRGVTGTLILPSPIPLAGSGQVGAVKYEMRLGKRTRVYCTVCLNFTPGSQGDLK